MTVSIIVEEDGHEQPNHMERFRLVRQLSTRQIDFANFDLVCETLKSMRQEIADARCKGADPVWP